MAVILLLFICLYTMFQLVVLSPTRTISLKTIFSFFLLGLFGVTALTFCIHNIISRFIDPTIVSYTLNPVIEETMKVLPVVLLLYFSRAGRNLGILDAMLLAAAVGTGYEIFESVCYINKDPLTFGFFYLSDFWKTLFLWLPQNIRGLSDYSTFNFYFFSMHSLDYIFTAIKGYAAGHGVWAAIIGLALGYSRKFIERGFNRAFALLFPLFFWAWAVFDHACFNYINSSLVPQYLPAGPDILYNISLRGFLLPYAILVLMIIAFFIELSSIKKGLASEKLIFLKSENGKLSFLRELAMLGHDLIARDMTKIGGLAQLFSLRRQLAWVNLDIANGDTGATGQAEGLRRKIVFAKAEIDK